MPFLGVYGSGGCLPAWNAVNRIFAESSNRKNWLFNMEKSTFQLLFVVKSTFFHVKQPILELF